MAKHSLNGYEYFKTSQFAVEITSYISEEYAAAWTKLDSS